MFGPPLLLLPLLLLHVTLSGAAHECERDCVVGDNRTCLYDFSLQEYHTLSRACYNCPEELADCSREECIAGDGVARPLITVNRQLPGPSVQVCEGDRVVVDLYNLQLSDTATIHWHGQHMIGQQYYDGVPYLTQCPVLGGTFRYNFLASTPGTHLWHSHIGLQRGSGIFGSLVVRQAEDPHRGLYDTDLPEHVVVLNDWIHTSIASKFLGRHHYTDDDYVRTILVNGKGRNSAAKFEGVEEVPLPLEVLQVTEGLKHRLRFIGGSGMNCPMVVSVDSHNLTIIATDGDPIIPFTADSFVIYSGERFDVVLEANQPVDNYWIRVNGLVDCSQLECVQGAVLRYEGAPIQDPVLNITYNPSYPPGVVVNPLNTDGAADEEVTMAELYALTPSSLPETVDRQFYLGFDFNQVNNTFFYNSELYPYNQVSEEWQVNTPQINDISFAFPASPPLSQPQDEQPTLCLYGQDPPCDGDFCSCTYVLEVALGETVEFVLVDEGSIGDENHPFHLHGYNFHVVAMGRLGTNTTVEEVAALDAAGGIDRRLEDTVRKDTVTIPDGGYTIVRFTADNPGWWLMHCHLVFHSETGMVAALHVGGVDDVPPVPEGFLTCGSFVPDI
uniref:Laccase n=1 Tax=Chiromantes haematocheir TaxID=151164 RepID=A0A7R7G1Z9_9EUCA|nr:laccase [Chiromantes haematocheir]